MGLVETATRNTTNLVGPASCPGWLAAKNSSELDLKLGYNDNRMWSAQEDFNATSRCVFGGFFMAVVASFLSKIPRTEPLDPPRFARMGLQAPQRIKNFTEDKKDLCNGIYASLQTGSSKRCFKGPFASCF